MPELARLDDADADLTAAFGRSLAAVARPGETWLLDGPLGAGKTHFARAFIRARLGNPEEEVPSPSFTLVQTYDDPRGGAVWHVDLYRLGEGGGEAVELGLEDAAPGDIRLIEWPDRLAAPPAGARRLRFGAGALPERRRLTVCGPPDGDEAARAAERARFLAGAGWGEALPAPLAGDASARRYFRLAHGPSGGAVLMDAPDGSLPDYLRMTGWLRDRGFHAPAILAADAGAGLALMEDLGDDLLARVLEARPELAGEAYGRLADLLAALHRHPPAPGTLALDGPELARQVGLFAEWYGPAAGGPGDRGPAIAVAVEALHAALCADAPPVTGLRDFHAENIVWFDDAPPGLLDFQDAVAVHPAYDLVSALQDVRRDVPEAVERAALARYLAATGAEPERFAAAYALLGAQRLLRILGIFARLCLRDGKPRYLAFMPRAWALLQRDLAHPALAPLAAAVAGFPPPTDALIEDLRQRCKTADPTR